MASPFGRHSEVARRVLAEARDPEALVRAPGRANLMGEHTDYNGGLVLPVALDVATYLAYRGSDEIVLRSLDRTGTVVVDPETGDGPTEGWGRYVTATVRALIDAGIEVRGIEGVVGTELPLGGGLSSSAALEVSLVLAVSARPLGALETARVCRIAENAYIGVPSGLMDPLASCAAEASAALMIDCGAETYATVAFPPDLAVLLIDSGLERELDATPYAERLRECADAANALGVDALASASSELIGSAGLEDVRLRRGGHVVSENGRVPMTAAALAADDLPELGRLFAASHRSLATDFEVSTPELDVLVGVARATEGVVAARMTGAGFGGCTVNLVRSTEGPRIGEAVAARYAAETGRSPRWWISRPSVGAAVSSL